MIERLFMGREQFLLPLAAGLLRDRYADSNIWDMSRVIVAVPGAQAARRLRRLLQEEAARANAHLTEPDIVTPAGLLETLYAPPRTSAGATACFFAWVQAVSRISEEGQKALAPKAEGADGPMVWAGIAREAQQARATAAAERLTLGKIAEQCAALPGVSADTRWQAFAHLECAYLSTLAEAGLSDCDDARMAALDTGRISCGKDIYLVGAQDLSGLERAMLGALKSPVVAIIPAPPEERDQFDESGSLRVGCWHEATLPIPNEAETVLFVDGPAEETGALMEAVAALNGQFALEEITVGIGDEAAAESLARRLAVLGLPSFSPFGRPLARVRPAALLGAIRNYLHAPTVRAFAALARHPDMETWLTARRTEAMYEAMPEPPGNAMPLLAMLDTYCAECLPTELPTGAGAQTLRESACPSGAKIARNETLTAHDAADLLLAPLRQQKKSLPQWAKPIMALLREVYADAPIQDDAEGRQFTRSLAGLQGILQQLKDLPPGLSPKVSGAEALAFVLGQAESERLPSEPASGAGLEMMGWLELALDDAPVLLLTGLQEGCVPLGGGDDSLLPDSLRRKLGLSDDRRRAARDGLLLRQMLESRQSGGRRARLIVSRRGADGSPRLPSRLLFACSAQEAARRVARFTDRSKDAAAAPLFAAGKARNLATFRPSLSTPPLTGMSVSAFGDYLACPYRFYLSHVLKLKAQDDSQEEMDPRLFGIVLHACLAAFGGSDAAQSVNPAEIREYFQRQLAAQCRKWFGANPSRAVQMQIRQAGRRLNAFAEWQAQSALSGWIIQPGLSERDLTATLTVDGQPFTIKGRPDRVDFHGAFNRYRLMDYKTGDTGKSPEEKHRQRDPSAEALRWAGLQLPLYRVLMSQNKIALDQMPPGEMGYALLSADLDLIDASEKKRRGGTGFVSVAWTEDDHDSALQSAEAVIRKVRAGIFWPPADPPPFPPSRTDPGQVDVFSGLCLDSCSDRLRWFAMEQEKTR